MTDSPDESQRQIQTDARELGALGYAQELFRTMGGFSNFAISFSIISILTGAVTLYEHGLTMGGPAEMAFGWPLVTVFTLAVALSMAELASALPTSGAMYHWACRLGGKGWGWFTAWFNITGQLAALAAIDYGCALFVTPLLGFPTTTANVLLVYSGVLLSHAMINHFGIGLVARLNDFSVTVHIIALSIKDIPSVLNARDAGGNEIPAVIAILTRALGERAGGMFTGLAAMAMWFCGLSAVTWSSRVIYAFARDNGLPASAVWRRVSEKHLTPAPAIWLCVFVAFLATVSSGTYAVVTSISVIGLYFSYIIPVYLAWRARGVPDAPRGPWHLGRFGSTINLVAILWVVFITAILSIPDNMRAGKTITILTVVLGAWYLLAERHRFGGPAWATQHTGAGASSPEVGADRA